MHMEASERKGGSKTGSIAPWYADIGALPRRFLISAFDIGALFVVLCFVLAMLLFSLFPLVVVIASWPSWSSVPAS